MPTLTIARGTDKTRSLDRTYAVLHEALEHIGGIRSFVRPGQSVLIRPDQSVPRLSETGATTDPLIVAALVRMALDAGAKDVRVGVSSWGFLDSLEMMAETGMAVAATQAGAECTELGGSNVSNREVDLFEGKTLQRVSLPEAILDADVTIAVPKARTSFVDHISGSLCYCEGSVNQNWRAYASCEADYLERLADVMMAIRPDLWITDALVCGEGDSPHASSPHWCGCILATADPVANDTAIASVLRCDWRKLQFAKALEHRGMGHREPLVVLGATLERVAFSAWPARQGVEYLPVNFIAGKGVTEAGTTGSVKAALAMLLQHGQLEQATRKLGTPTILAGDAEDPNFGEHIAAGPYFVFDDAAPDKYKSDPRVHFVPGHPVMETALPALMKALGIRQLS